MNDRMASLIRQRDRLLSNIGKQNYRRLLEIDEQIMAEEKEKFDEILEFDNFGLGVEDGHVAIYTTNIQYLDFTIDEEKAKKIINFLRDWVYGHVENPPIFREWDRVTQ